MEKFMLSRFRSNAIALTALFLLVCISAAAGDKKKNHYIDISTTERMFSFFRYTGDEMFFISSHRGGPETGFPENSIETFANTLKYTWSLMECDPRYTKDSIIILLHDPVLDRTTTGHGKVTDYTFEELKLLKLKDLEGEETAYRIPTLDEALEWSKGKTILVLDKKDVPVEKRVQMVTEHHAETNAIVMAYTFEEAKTAYGLNPDIMMQIFINTPGKIADFEKTGVPWENVVVFTGHQEPGDPELFDLLHQKGVLCIMGTSRNLDRKYSEGEVTGIEEMRTSYYDLFRKGADILETDIPVPLSRILPELPETKSIKRKCFKLK